MKKSDFIDRIEKLRRRTFGSMFIATIIFIVVLCLGIFYVEMLMTKLEAALMLNILVTCVYCLILSGLFLYFIIASSKARARKLEVNCEHCGDILNPHQVVIATGNCPHCGERVLDPE